jgi:hypothetical protein
MKLAFQFDGLLQRFDQLAPGAVAMLERMHRIRRRAEKSPYRKHIELVAVRFRSLSADAPEEEEPQFREEVGRAGLEHYFRPMERCVRVLQTVADLQPAQGGNQARDTIFFSSSLRLVQEAQRASVTAYHIREYGAPGESWLSCSDAPRRVEEVLRMPIARPIAPERRSGALLATQLQNVEDVQELCLKAFREDPNAEWFVLGRQLILYTENTDFEDRLVDQEGYTRLSFSVKKSALAIENAATRTSSQLCFEHGYSLSERPEANAQARAGTRVFGWDAVKFRAIRARQMSASGLNIGGGADERFHALERKLRQVLIAANGDQASRFYRAIESCLPPGAATDIVTHEGHPLAVTWFGTSPVPLFENTAVIILSHPGLTRNSAVSDEVLFALAVALTLTCELAIVLPTARFFYGIRLASDVSIKQLLEFKLFANEYGGLSGIVEIQSVAQIPRSSHRMWVEYSEDLQWKLGALATDRGGLIAEPVGNPQAAWPRMRLSIEAGHAASRVSIKEMIAVISTFWCEAPRDRA